MFGYIYVVTNLLNGIKYVGQKKSDIFLGARYLGSGKLVSRAVAKYGNDNFKVEMLEECFSQDQLNTEEQFWISKLDTFRNGYNLTSGGHQTEFSAESIKKMSESAKKRCTKCWRERESILLTGKKMPEETKIKISKRLKEMCKSGEFQPPRVVWTDEMRKNRSESRTGTKRSEETKKIMSENHADFNGSNNPAFGRKWINNGNSNKYVKEQDLPIFLNNGWNLGMLKKSHSATTIEQLT
jgi:group I intron endonuclease